MKAVRFTLSGEKCVFQKAGSKCLLITIFTYGQIQNE